MIVAILGAGPAGMSCANACLSFGLTPVVIERSAYAGGVQRGNFHTNLWMLGSPGESGQVLTQRLVAHYRSLGVRTLLEAHLALVEPDEVQGFRLHVESASGAQIVRADAVVICTGMRPRATPALLALAASSSRVVIGALNDVIRDHIHTADTLILGGGDNALDHALFLAERGNRVRVCTRRRFSGRETLLDACRAHPAITLSANCQPERLLLEGEQVLAWWPGMKAPMRYDWLLVMYGYHPNTEVVASFAPVIRPHVLAGGHVQVDGWLRTSTPGIYAAGDVTDNVQPAVPTAIAQGLAAAKAIERGMLRAEPGAA